MQKLLITKCRLLGKRVITATEMLDSILFGNINRGFEEYRTTSSTILVDVREANEFATGHIPGAVNAPLSTISKQRS